MTIYTNRFRAAELKVICEQRNKVSFSELLRLVNAVYEGGHSAKKLKRKLWRMYGCGVVVALWMYQNGELSIPLFM